MIGYYAHSHGNGHCNYARLFASVRPKYSIILTDRKYNFKSLNHIPLVNEHCTGDEWDRTEYKEPGYLHYAPIGLRNITERNIQILQTIKDHNIELMIIDVSVEVAALMRVSSIPYAYVRMMGNRNDSGHIQAYEGASFLLAYYPEVLEPKSTPQWIREKTIYLGFVTDLEKPKSSSLPDIYAVLIMGQGGHSISNSLLDHLSKTLGNKKLHVIGDCKKTDHSNLIYKGFVNNVSDYIQSSNIIIAACGSNLTSEILAQGKPFLILPQERPYEEQKVFAEALENAQMGIILKEDTVAKNIYEIEELKFNYNPSYFNGFESLWKLFESNKFNFSTIIKQNNTNSTKIYG